MSATPALGALLGLLIGLGVVLVVSCLPAHRRPRLADRVEPYLGDRPGSARRRVLLGDRAVTPFPTLERILRPYLADGADRLERVLGGTTSVRRRLEQSGSARSVQEFRVEQLVWGAAGFGGAVVVSLLMLANGSARSPLVLVVFCVAAGVGGVLLRDNRLTRAVREREARMMAEFPTVADLLALSVAAGEGAVGALERVARISTGELAGELRRALADARTGSSLTRALDAIAERTSLPALARFVDGIAVAVERGTPLADVLRAQAADVREARRRNLLEIGGRKEIAMMVDNAFRVLGAGESQTVTAPGRVNVTGHPVAYSIGVRGSDDTGPRRSQGDTVPSAAGGGTTPGARDSVSSRQWRNSD